MAQSSYQVKKEIVDICQRIYQRGYVAANDGNVSVRLDNGLFMLTPTGMSKGFLEPEHIVTVDADGKQVAGTCRPSSESLMHLQIYKERTDVNAVVHAHPPTATGFAVSGIPLTKCVLPEVIISVGSIPIAEYKAPGTQELADCVVRYLKQYDAILLENHGALTVGDSVTSAHYKMETMEHFAKIMFVAYQLGGVKALPGEDVQELIAARQRFGVRSDAPVCEINGLFPKSAGAEKDEIEQVTEEVTRRVMAALQNG